MLGSCSYKVRFNYQFERYARSYIHLTPASMHDSSTCASCAYKQVNIK